MAFAQEQDLSSGMKKFMRAAMQAGLLQKEEEYALVNSWQQQQDGEALQKLLLAHGRQVVSQAQKFRHYGLPLSDLVQEGQLGLLQAANRFETTKDVRFSTYASWWIKACMQDFVLRNWSIVRTGTTAAHKSLFFNMRRLRRQLEEGALETLSQQGRKHIATMLNVSVKDVEEMEVRLGQGDQPLSATLGTEGDDSYQDFLVDSRPTPEQTLVASNQTSVQHTWLVAAFSKLNPRERQIIKARRLEENAVTLEELGTRLGISKERVRQLEVRAMEKITAVVRGLAGEWAGV